MEHLNEHLANLKHPQLSMEHLNRREQGNRIHFPKTRLHGRLELERGTVWFLEKESSHWMIHFLETHLHGIRDPSRMRNVIP